MRNRRAKRVPRNARACLANNPVLIAVAAVLRPADETRLRYRGIVAETCASASVSWEVGDLAPGNRTLRQLSAYIASSWIPTKLFSNCWINADNTLTRVSSDRCGPSHAGADLLMKDFNITTN